MSGDHQEPSAPQEQAQSQPTAQENSSARAEPATGSAGDFHYLDTIRLLANRIDPGLYKTYFEDHWQDDSGSQVLMITSALVQPVNSGDLEPGSYVSSKLLGHLDEASQSPCLLLVSGIGPQWTQYLGNAVNLDPKFVARHIGSLLTCYNASSELDILSSDFSTLLRRKEKKDTPCVKPTRTLNSYHLVGELQQTFSERDGKICFRQEGFPDAGLRWDNAGTDRICQRPGGVTLQPRLSLCQVAAQGCKSLHQTYKSWLVD